MDVSNRLGSRAAPFNYEESKKTGSNVEPALTRAFNQIHPHEHPHLAPLRVENNPAELKLPLTDKKLVIAHCMTHIIRYKGHSLEPGCNSKYYPLKKSIPESLGGYTQVNVLSDTYLKDATLEQAVEFEMLAAKKSGIDGFQFYYTLGLQNNDKIIETYFKVAREKNIDFKLTFCFSRPSHPDMNETQKVELFANRINKIMDNVGRDDPNWLRTPDGRLIVYLWYGEQLADIPPVKLREGKPSYFYAAQAYNRLAHAIGERFACLYSIHNNVTDTSLNQILDHFPNVWLWIGAYKFPGYDASVAAKCAERGRAFAASAFNDFYTSKLLERNFPKWDIANPQKAAVLGIDGVERRYLQTGLSQTFRNQMVSAIKNNSPLINIISWNDYPEGHHFAPEVNHNDGFSILLKHYKSILTGKESPYKNRDVAITFFKKYQSNITAKPYGIFARNLGSTAPGDEDSIEVITILPQAAKLVVNDASIAVPKGLTVHKFRHQIGPVNVAIVRDNKIAKCFKTPEWITDNPLRTDRLTYTFSTELQDFHKDIFKGMAPMYSTEYNQIFNSGKALNLNYTPVLCSPSNSNVPCIK